MRSCLSTARGLALRIADRCSGDAVRTPSMARSKRNQVLGNSVIGRDRFDSSAARTGWWTASAPASAIKTCRSSMYGRLQTSCNELQPHLADAVPYPVDRLVEQLVSAGNDLLCQPRQQWRKRGLDGHFTWPHIE